MVTASLWLVFLGIATTVSEAKLRPAKPQVLGFVTIPITRQTRPESNGIHPQIRHAQHVNRALKRRALMESNPEPKADILLGNIVRSIENLPAKHRKRFDLDLGEVVSGLIKGAAEVTSETAGIVFHALGFRPHGHQSSASHHVTTPKRPAGNSAGQGGYSPVKAEASNNNTLTKAVTATFKDSTGLDIEANDLGYIAEMSIGTPPRSFKLLVDSGSADLWVGGEDCKSAGSSCGPHSLLGPKSSSSFVMTGQNWSIQYGSGSTEGDVVRDNVAIAGLELKKHTFGVAKNESSQFSDESVPFDGILGLAKTSLSQQQSTTLVEAFHSAGLIKAPITSYKLSRVSDQNNDGVITFGGMDPSQYDAGAMVVLPNANTAGFFSARMDSVLVDGKTLDFSNKTAILDTGTSLILVPDADAKAIHAHIPGAKYSKELVSYTLPCNSTTSVQIQFGGRAFEIQSSDITYLPVDPDNLNGDCVSGIVSGNIGYDNTWLCGDVFLKNVYFSTDAEKDTITIAKLA